MQLHYNYASPSMCLSQGDQTVLGLSPDLSRDEKVSFHGKLKNPLIFRDAMLMLREIVISDQRQQKKERPEFFAWLDGEIERRIQEHEQYMPNVRDAIQDNMKNIKEDIGAKDTEISKLLSLQREVKKQIDQQDAWKDYYQLEHAFWKFIKDRDYALWFVLDPVITVHQDQVSFEAFSLDESTYGCLSVEMDEFELLGEPKLGTTNIDFSAKLAKEMERFRTYNEVELSVNPGGFTVDTGIMPQHVEKKIDLPETWIKGFTQVSSAASLDGIHLELTPVDMLDLCSFMRRYKADRSPRYMKWILEPNQPVKVVMMPFEKELTLQTIYQGDRPKEEKIWGRRRWLVMEKLIPVAKSFHIKLLGFGMPQFITADMGSMKMTIGFTSWSSNDWVKGTAFNIMAGYVGTGQYDEVYNLLKEHRALGLPALKSRLKDSTTKDIKAGIGMLFRKGEGYYDPLTDLIRFRQLCQVPLPEELYASSDLELKVVTHLEEEVKDFKIRMDEKGTLIATHALKMPNPKRNKWRYYNTDDYTREFDLTDTEIHIDEDGQITKVSCSCPTFKKGPRNISGPCSHILAVYMMAGKFTKLKLEPHREYNMNAIMELLL